MSFELMLTYGSFGFAIILLFVYLKKQKLKTASTNAYTLLLITTLIYSLIEIIYVILIKKYDTLFTTILSKTHFLIGILWLYNLYHYVEAIIIEKNGKKYSDYLKSSVLIKIVSTIVIICMVISIILPTKINNNNELIFLPMNNLIVYMVIYLLTFVTIIIRLNKNKKVLILKEKELIIRFSLITIFFLIFQVAFNNISFLSFMYYLYAVLVYLFIENPDLKLIQELSTAKLDIENSNKTKTEFLSNMSYEIKVPMTLIVSLCDELNSMAVFNENIFKENIAQIAASGNSMLDIVNNILDISKIETGKSTLQEKDYKINSLLTDVINIAKSKIGTKQVKLVINIDQNISSSFNGDYAKIYQVLLNIVSNSAKYTEVGKITFTLTSTKSSGIEKLLFKVSDTGSGIKDEDKEKLFEKGTKLGNTVSGEIEGSGLGLAITKEYIELLGGKIWFDSQYRVGTTFYIEIPQKIVDATPLSATIQQENKAVEKLDCTGRTVLIVDDNQLNIKVAKRLLESYKFTIDSANSGKDCIYKIKEGKKYDGIFMDHMMPEMDGIETMKILRKLDGYELPPIIALTANAVAGMREMYLNEGFDEYLSKPINTSELDRIVNLFYNKK